MQKFGEIYKRKLNESETRQETKVLDEFKIVYKAMLEHYGLKAINSLNEQSKLSFLTELNRYWTEEEGLSEKGKNFVNQRLISLNENSTSLQKKNFLRAKSYAVINETFRQSNIKYKLYDVIDEMYKELNASNLNDILSSETITSIILESFNRSLIELTNNIGTELKESANLSEGTGDFRIAYNYDTEKGHKAGNITVNGANEEEALKNAKLALAKKGINKPYALRAFKKHINEDWRKTLTGRSTQEKEAVKKKILDDINLKIKGLKRNPSKYAYSNVPDKLIQHLITRAKENNWRGHIENIVSASDGLIYITYRDAKSTFQQAVAPIAAGTTHLGAF